MKLVIEPFDAFRVGGSYTLACHERLEARTGRVTVLFGESGSGKSVLMQILAGYRAGAGAGGPIKATVHGSETGPVFPIEDFVAEPTRISYLPQQSVLRPDLTAGRALSDWRRILGTAYDRQPEVRAAVEKAREHLVASIFSPAERAALFEARHPPRIRELSGGQKRRLDVIMALCSPAELVLLDEPDSGLDRDRRAVLFETLRAFARDEAKIVLVISHYVGEDPAADNVDTWLATRTSDGAGATFTGYLHETDREVTLPLHEPPAERGNMRLDQFLVYCGQRRAELLGGRPLFFLLAPLLLMFIVRLAIYPHPTQDGPSMALLFFYAVTCFWLGAAQSTTFWSNEQVFFDRECRQAASSFAYVLSFMTVMMLMATIQAGLAACALKFADWSALLTGAFSSLGSDLNIGLGRIALWGAWSAINGIVIGLAAATAQHLLKPRLTGAVTAQLLALVITLSAIVFSFPVIGAKTYDRIVDDVHTADRFEVARQAARKIKERNEPVPAILLAEVPLAVNPSFHGLWFQGERPLRYHVASGSFDNFQKEGAPEAGANASILTALTAGILGLAYRLKKKPRVA